jgi:hypothetical protein
MQDDATQRTTFNISFSVEDICREGKNLSDFSSGGWEKN